MRAKKSLGQHFLRSEKALTSIIDAAEPSAADLILEIGPGQGVLTERLMFFAGKVIAIEKDDELYDYLFEKYAGKIADHKLDLVHGDALEFNQDLLAFYHDFIYKIVANIPYNITGGIFKKFLSAKYQPERMVLLVQKEVAERIIAKDKKESILSVAVKSYGRPKYIETVKAGSFAPAPSVDSAILLVDNISKAFFKRFPEEKFFEMLRTGFKSKRKKLSSNLKGLYNKEKVSKTFEKMKLDDNIRAEDLTLLEWQGLAQGLIS